MTLSPAKPPAARRRPGRPQGSRSRVLQDARALGVYHFSFVRAGLLGMDLAQAFERYLAWSETTSDLRYVQNRHAALLKQIIEAARHLDAARPADNKLTPYVDLLRSGTQAKAAAVLPSLDEWVEAEGMDPEGWSEAELLAEYQAHFGLDNRDGIEAAEQLHDPVAKRARALDYLEALLVKLPSASDRLDTWFSRPVAKVLRNVGLLTLADLVNFINVYDYGWHKRIRGFGKQRADQVVEWLVKEKEQLQLSLSAQVHEPKSKREARLAAMGLATSGQVAAVELQFPELSQFGLGSRSAAQLGQLQRLRADSGAGQGGDFLSHMANTLGAKNDLQAVSAWLSRYDEKPHTQRSYRKEAERFMLWCALELKKPLSSVNALDCQAYRKFLQAVPSLWMQKLSVPRSDHLWKAFRTQPSASTQKQALVIVQTLFGALVDAGYLVANPMRAILKTLDLPTNKVNVSRSFAEAEWSHVLQTLQELPEGPQRLRLQCILELLVTSGIRLDELARARHKDLRIERLPDLPASWILTVTGKRNKTREVPLQSHVVDLLRLHGQTFLAKDLKAKDDGELPLIRTLKAPVAQWGRAEDGAVDAHGETMLVAKPRTEETGLALSASALYASLKSFFKRAAKTAGAAGLDPERFTHASTHWMRHTFVRQALVDGLPIEVVSELAGHASIDTTSIYSTQELARKIKAVQDRRRRIA